MGKFLKRFDTHSQYESYTANTDTFILPNVSICDDQPDVVHYNPWSETRVIAKFNVTSTANPTAIAYSDNWVSAIEIDGVAQPSVVTAYTFDSTGEHTVRYTLADPTVVGAQAFTDCYDIINVIIPDSVELIGDEAFEACSGLTSVTIGDNVTEIGTQAFMNCLSLTSVSIPDSVETIGNRVFRYCTSLRMVTIGNGVTEIGNSAFMQCSNLLLATIGSGVTVIGNAAFNNCSSLTSITVEATTPPTLGSLAFKDTNNCPIYVPSASFYVYRAANNWRTYYNRLFPMS